MGLQAEVCVSCMLERMNGTNNCCMYTMLPSCRATRQDVKNVEFGTNQLCAALLGSSRVLIES
jgi:hypothetical protein